MPNLLVRQHRLMKTLGVFNYFLHVFYELVNRLIELKVLQVNYIPPVLTNNPVGEWLNGRRLAEIEDKNLELHSAWLEAAIRNDQQAAVLFEDKKLVSYFWLSDLPVRTNPHYTTIISPEYFYGYKAFTRSDRRGRGLLLKLIELSSHHAYLQGKKGIITHVEINNFASRRAHARANAKIVGFHVLVRLRFLHFEYNSPGCKPFSSRLVHHHDEGK